MHIQSMVHALDEEVFRLMECQITDIENKRYGGYLMPSYHVEPRMSGFAFSRLVLAYVCKESSHYLSGKVEQAIRANLTYMQQHQRPDGCFDLSGCNFASPPDTAFMINAVLNAWWVMEKRNVPEAAWLRDPMYRMIDSSTSGIAAGGSTIFPTH
jgi:hypothetical protein